MAGGEVKLGTSLDTIVIEGQSGLVQPYLLRFPPHHVV